MCEHRQLLEDMAVGRPYDDFDPWLADRRKQAAAAIARYTQCYGQQNETGMQRALDELLHDRGEGAHIVPPFSMEFGFFVTLGAGSFVNQGSIWLDCAPVTIGREVMMGPRVCFFTSDHALLADERLAGDIVARPITVGDRVWIGGNTTILGGVHIGDEAVIGAGSVVTRDIPPKVVAVGNPCRVLRPITEKDRLRR